MGFFYYFHSLALSEDLPGIEEKHFSTTEEFLNEANQGFNKVGNNRCAILSTVDRIEIPFLSDQPLSVKSLN